MKTTGKTWKELEKAAMKGSNGNLWSQPYVPLRRNEDYIYIFTSEQPKKNKMTTILESADCKKFIHVKTTKRQIYR